MTNVISESTIDGLADTTSTKALWGRRFAMTLIGVAVLAGASGLLGLHTSRATAEGNGYRLTLEYPAVARAGWDTRWHVELTRDGGFGKEITIAVTGDYLDIFETQALWPDATSTTRDAKWLYLTFEAPPGDTFVLDYDAYIQPASQIGRSARIAVMEDGVEQVGIDYKTRLVP